VGATRLKRQPLGCLKVLGRLAVALSCATGSGLGGDWFWGLPYLVTYRNLLTGFVLLPIATLASL
jgi:hypothetical protein